MRSFFCKIKNARATAVFITVSVLSILLVLVLFVIGGKDSPVGPFRSDRERGRVNILLAGRDDTSGLYDALMLLSFDRDGGSAFVLQIPRDTYAEYTSSSYKKLNGASAALGGMDKFLEFAEENMGVELDGYVSFDLDVLSEVVDALGGVVVDVPDDMYYEDEYQDLRIDLKAGRQRLDGESAEMLVRYRSGYPRGDIDRLDVQKLFMRALFETVKECDSFGLILELLPTLDSFRTDLPFTRICALAYEARDIASDRVEFATLPGREATATASGASYYVADRKKTAEIFESHFGAEADSFDPRKVFLNGDYREFEDIYYGIGG